MCDFCADLDTEDDCHKCDRCAALPMATIRAVFLRALCPKCGHEDEQITEDYAACSKCGAEYLTPRFDEVEGDD